MKQFMKQWGCLQSRAIHGDRTIVLIPSTGQAIVRFQELSIQINLSVEAFFSSGRGAAWIFARSFLQISEGHITLIYQN